MARVAQILKASGRQTVDRPDLIQLAYFGDQSGGLVFVNIRFQFEPDQMHPLPGRRR